MPSAFSLTKVCISLSLISIVSMLDPWNFELMNLIARIIQYNLVPFGGIHIVVCGDFLQLPAAACDKFAFECDTWAQSIVRVCLVFVFVASYGFSVYQGWVLLALGRCLHSCLCFCLFGSLRSWVGLVVRAVSFSAFLSLGLHLGIFCLFSFVCWVGYLGWDFDSRLHLCLVLR